MTILFSLSIIIICYLLYSNQKQKLLLVNYQESKFRFIFLLMSQG